MFAPSSPGRLLSLALLCTAWTPLLTAQDFPAFTDLKPQTELPNPLVAMSGQKITTKEAWEKSRRPELKQLFQHYMYGKLPAVPEALDVKELCLNRNFLGGKATLRELAVRFTLPRSSSTADMAWSKHTIYVLLVTPNERLSPAPVFIGMNFCGNHAVVESEQIQIPETWVYNRCEGTEKDHATAKGRGTQADVWNVDLIIDRGYSLASFYSGDIDPDTADFADGLNGELKPDLKFAGDDAGTIACWSWGYHRVIDALTKHAKEVAKGNSRLDLKKIAVVGHSRNGKTALLAAAMDDRIALAIPSQAGCGGTAPSRGTVGESVKRINTSFPHWFCDEFTNFNDEPARLPFDQNCLAAICAPRPVLFANAQEDTWANPDGQLEVLKAAAPAYALYGKRGIDSDAKAEMGKLIGHELGYFIRPGKHSMSRVDWQAYLDFADKHFSAN
ncbi:Alpha/beta hydrolase family protein [Anatilimnocola aggregata]|uniref:Alpha/beta hydrolase family protein n=1 Tax=Anatilimnocola aggregata TaxID=2528021 RepID=A0A517YK00_9BACT|nr:acetylxylan esterase [Anatilimnocola aggregata]QDU30551.1 Alpha/beta hydrolase family protein [Anatilimnocola aggregata]